MECLDCRADVPEGARFCPSCGARLPLVCPYCSSPLPPGGRFCPACGARVVEAAAGSEASAQLPLPQPATGLAPLPLAFRGSLPTPGPDVVLGEPPAAPTAEPPDEEPA